MKNKKIRLKNMHIYITRSYDRKFVGYKDINVKLKKKKNKITVLNHIRRRSFVNHKQPDLVPTQTVFGRRNFTEYNVYLTTSNICIVIYKSILIHLC